MNFLRIYNFFTLFHDCSFPVYEFCLFKVVFHIKTFTRTHVCHDLGKNLFYTRAHVGTMFISICLKISENWVDLSRSVCQLP